MRIWIPLLLLAIASAHAAEPKFPPPAPGDPAVAGIGVQRTLTLLATSTPEKRNKVRILFYGQSITEQAWTKLVADDLRKRFPHADLEIENRAIGGFAAQMLILPAEHDLYPFYPDLLIFHVYGDQTKYEQIIRNVRSRTTAEVLMQKDHVAAKWPWETPAKWPPDPKEREKDTGMWWDSLMNNRFLPEIAQKHGCTLLDVRTPWVAYLKDNKLEPKALLKDGVHLNDQGNYLLAQLVSRHLVHRPDLDNSAWKDLVRTYEVGKDVNWKDGKLTLEFDGNRVDVIPAPGAVAGVAAQVRIDGKKPSEFAELYAITRPQPGPWSPLTVARVDHEKPLVPEEWTLKVTEVDAESKRWSFEVSGSVTGADGAGNNGGTFVSKSGRVKIEPSAFFRNGKVPVGWSIKWRVIPLHVEQYQTPSITDRAKENATTLAQGLNNGRHTLELSSEGPIPAIRAIRVHQPPGN